LIQRVSRVNRGHSIEAGAHASHGHRRADIAWRKPRPLHVTETGPLQKRWDRDAARGDANYRGRACDWVRIASSYVSTLKAVGHPLFSASLFNGVIPGGWTTYVTEMIGR
jgi:hypothetical protein